MPQEVSLETSTGLRSSSLPWFFVAGNDPAVTTEPKYERLETAKDGDTRAARCESPAYSFTGMPLTVPSLRVIVDRPLQLSRGGLCS